MCGRFVAASSADDLADYFGAILDGEADLRATYPDPSFNVAPTDTAPVVRSTSRGPLLTPLRWGLLPFWAKRVQEGSRYINARAETITEKRAFNRAFIKRRCLVPIDGFYEWKAVAVGQTSLDLDYLDNLDPVPGDDSGDTAGVPETKKRTAKPQKIPHYIHHVDGEPLVLAGIWSRWSPRDSDDEPIDTFSIITCEANGVMALIHDRMPVILKPSDWSTWLDPSTDSESQLLTLLRPAPDSLLSMYRVSKQVNSVRNNGPELLEPYEEAA